MSAHIKKNEVVVVIRGAHKGKRGKLLALINDGERGLVEGVAIVKKAVRKSQERPEGGYLEREAPIHVSNLMSGARYDARQAKRGKAPAQA